MVKGIIFYILQPRVEHAVGHVHKVFVSIMCWARNTRNLDAAPVQFIRSERQLLPKSACFYYSCFTALFILHYPITTSTDNNK